MSRRPYPALTGLWARILALLSTALPAAAAAQAHDAGQEAPDPTRLDVERLPPEALAITRDMYATGAYLAAELGGRGFAGGAGRVSQLGVLARVNAGYELLPWLSLASVLSLSFHETDAPAPPSATSFQVYSLLAQAKLQWAPSVRSALWLAAEAGFGWASGDFLPAWGYEDADEAALVYGGSLGFDWHLRNAHHSLGLRAGAQRYPHFDGPDGDPAIGIEGSAYLKYVF